MDINTYLEEYESRINQDESGRHNVIGIENNYAMNVVLGGAMGEGIFTDGARGGRARSLSRTYRTNVSIDITRSYVFSPNSKNIFDLEGSSDIHGWNVDVIPGPRRASSFHVSLCVFMLRA